MILEIMLGIFLGSVLIPIGLFIAMLIIAGTCALLTGCINFFIK